MLKTKLMQTWVLPPRELRLIIAILLCLGIFFRFVNLDGKVYWFDETYTSLRASGYTEAELVQNLSNTSVIDIEALQRYQRPNSEKGVVDTIRSLAAEDPQHPPFYYLIVRFWMQKFGSSPSVMRSLPALISLLVFPCIYWLCLELFESTLRGWIAVALIAVSPLHILYAQESREYSLWTVTILLSSATFLRAVRLNNRGSWAIYAVTLVASLYTFLLSAFMAIGHAIYLAVIERFRLSKTLISYFIASCIGIIAFIPWIYVVLSNRVQAQSVTAWTGVIKKPLWELLKIWGINLSRVFIDFNYNSQDGLIQQAFLTAAIILLVVFVVYSLYFICRNTPQRIWLFILTLMGTTSIPFILPDLVLGGVRSTTPRYFIPCYLGIQISVSYLLASKITSINSNAWKQKIWHIFMVILVSAGIWSCVISSEAKAWWHQTLNRDTPLVANIINKADRPLVISDNNSADILSLSYLLNSKVRFMFKPQCYTSCNALHSKNKSIEVEDKPYLPKIPKGFTDVFISKTAPSEEWKRDLDKEKSYKTELVIKPASEEFVSWLWKIKN